jgi:sugar phosphate isomerase/epimerase
MNIRALPINLMNRRTFLSLGAAGLMGSKALLRKPEVDKKKKLGKIALQLYTVRREIEKDLYGTLQKVADIGFTYVGLKVCAVHCEVPVGMERAKFLELAEAYQCDAMIWHGWPEDPRYTSEDGIRKLADIYNESSNFAQQNGLLFGFHNHWWEFRNQINGKYPYQILRPLLDHKIFFELDTYWIKVAGLDPAKIVGEFANKAPLLHIKDGPARYSESLGEDDPDPMTAVGKGAQDFPLVVKAARGNTRWMIVEMDKTTADVFQALAESYRYLIDNKLAIDT